MAALVPFDRLSSVPFHRQIYEGYRAAIVDGRLRPGDRLPATRDLADALSISRTPVLDAFDRLRYEGYVFGRVGSGTFVATTAGGATGRPRVDQQNLLATDESPDLVLPADRWLPQSINPPLNRLRPFLRNVPALDLFPHRVWNRLVRRHLSSSLQELVSFGDPAGHRPLRESLARYLRTARLVHCDPDQVLVVSGQQMALQICAIALLAKDESVAVEECTRLSALHGLSVLRVPVELIPPEQGEADDDDLPAGMHDRARLAYVTPGHRYLLGGSMSEARRRQLLRWAESKQAWILEQDFDGDLRHNGSRPIPLHSESTSDRVIYLGNLVRTMFPALRIAALVVPRRLARTFIKVREALDLAAPPLHQFALADFIDEGHFVRHVRRMRTLYRARRDALVDALESGGRDLVTVHHVDAGLDLAISLPTKLSDHEVARRAAHRGISTLALSDFYPERNGLILGFGCVAADQLGEATRSLLEVIRSALLEQPGP